MVWALPKEDTKAAKNAKSTKGTKAVIDSCTHRVADQIGWSNWGGKVTTLAPVFRVKTDKDLRQIIKYSKKDGACTVRVTGATHSEDGLVMQRGEKNVVLIHWWITNQQILTGCPVSSIVRLGSFVSKLVCLGMMLVHCTGLKD